MSVWPILAPLAVRVLAFTGSEETVIPHTYGQQGVKGDLRKSHMTAKITRFAGLELVIQMLCEWFARPLCRHGLCAPGLSSPQSAQGFTVLLIDKAESTGFSPVSAAWGRACVCE